MIKIDLITGFLGAGKTTFIRMYAKYLLGTGKRIAILENDYGAINVDMLMLKDLEGDNCDLEMVIGGNDYDCHKRRLKSKLITLGMLGYDRVIMEPSGIFDVDEFMDTLHEEPLDQWYEIGTIVSIVDAKLADDLSDESDYLLVSQTADAGVVVFSKSQLAEKTDIDRSIAHINRAFAKFRTNRTLTDADNIVTKDWKNFTAADFENILGAGYVLKDHVKMPITDNNNYQSLFYMDVDMSPEELRPKADAIFADASCGHVIRIKGFLKTGEKQTEAAGQENGGQAAGGDKPTWVEINATRDDMQVTPAPDGQEVIIVIGENLDRARIGSYWNYRYGSGHEQLDNPGPAEEAEQRAQS